MPSAAAPTADDAAIARRRQLAARRQARRRRRCREGLTVFRVALDRNLFAEALLTAGRVDARESDDDARLALEIERILAEWIRITRDFAGTLEVQMIDEATESNHHVERRPPDDH